MGYRPAGFIDVGWGTHRNNYELFRSVVHDQRKLFMEFVGIGCGGFLRLSDACYDYISIAWSTGGIIARLLSLASGRYLNLLSLLSEAHFHERPVGFRELFGQNEFVKKYPYFLPCTIPATFSAVAWVVRLIW